MLDQIKYLLALESYKFMHTNIIYKDDYDKLSLRPYSLNKYRSLLWIAYGYV